MATIRERERPEAVDDELGKPDGNELTEASLQIRA